MNFEGRPRMASIKGENEVKGENEGRAEPTPERPAPSGELKPSRAEPLSASAPLPEQRRVDRHLTTEGIIALMVALAFLLRLPYKLENRFVSFPVPPKPRMAVVITGTSSGIGKHAALHLDGMGVTVYCCVRKQADADALLAESPSLRPVIMDIAEPAIVKSAVDHILHNASGDALDICGLVNNAG